MWDQETLRAVSYTHLELTNRIYKYFEEINEEPIVFRWKYNLDDIDVSEEIVVDTLPVLSLIHILPSFMNQLFFHSTSLLSPNSAASLHTSR